MPHFNFTNFDNYKTSIQIVIPYFNPLGGDICCFQTFPFINSQLSIPMPIFNSPSQQEGGNRFDDQ